MIIRFRQMLKCRKGQSMVEFALVAICFFAFFLVFVDLMKLAYVWVTLQYSVNKTIRWSRPDVYTETAIEDKIKAISSGLGVQLSTDLGGTVTVTIEDTMVEIDVLKDVEINPLAGLMLQFMGSGYATTYTINIHELVSRKVKNIRHDP